jgi:hypothetical protein
MPTGHGIAWNERPVMTHRFVRQVEDHYLRDVAANRVAAAGAQAPLQGFVHGPGHRVTGG